MALADDCWRAIRCRGFDDVIRLTVPVRTEAGFLAPLARWLAANHPSLSCTPGAGDPDVLLTSHYSTSIRSGPRTLQVFLDGESGTAYSAERDAPIEDAFGAHLYVGPLANHRRLERLGIECIDIPFAVLSRFERVSGDVSKLAGTLDDVGPAAPTGISYLSSNPTGERETFYRNLKHAGDQFGVPVVALGRCGSPPGFVPSAPRETASYLDGAVAALAGFSHNMAFENERVSGYLTEKMVNAALAGAIPIYFGCGEAGELFNPDSFIAIDDPLDPKAATRVVQLCSNIERSREMRAAPILRPGAYERWFGSGPSSALGELADRITALVDQRDRTGPRISRKLTRRSRVEAR